MKVLVIGSGGREHALAWKLSLSESVSEVLVAPGNAGTSLEAKIRNLDVAPNDFEKLVETVRLEGIEFTIVGPEAPLVEGIVDYFHKEGLACFGPMKKAAQLEGSKAFTKQFLEKYSIPTGKFETFDDLQTAVKYVEKQGVPIVIKADGLAAGKGVVIAKTIEEATESLKEMLSGESFGDAGKQVVIEEFLEGEEASFICLCDGKTAIPFASSQDHKTRDEGDKGPNTGGMGAYSPAPVVDNKVHERVMLEIIEPTLRGMTEEGSPYVGFLYAGLMIDQDGQPKVIEYNCRFGDPEAQPVFFRLRSDLLEACQKAVSGDLADYKLEFDKRVALGVVMAAGGYPFEYKKGAVIRGLEDERVETKVFHAGSIEVEGEIRTNGGRVLCVVGIGDDIRAAAERAYSRVSTIAWDQHYYRRDIGHRAMDR